MFLGCGRLLEKHSLNIYINRFYHSPTKIVQILMWQFSNAFSAIAFSLKNKRIFIFSSLSLVRLSDTIWSALPNQTI